MYHLLAIYITMLPIFFVVMYIEASECTTVKATSNDWVMVAIITILWPLFSWVTKEYWAQAYWAFQLRRGSLLQSKENPKTIIHYTKGDIYYWKTNVAVGHIRGTSWRIYHPITFKEL